MCDAGGRSVQRVDEVAEGKRRKRKPAIGIRRVAMSALAGVNDKWMVEERKKKRR